MNSGQDVRSHGAEYFEESQCLLIQALKQLVFMSTFDRKDLAEQEELVLYDEEWVLDRLWLGDDLTDKINQSNQSAGLEAHDGVAPNGVTAELEARSRATEEAALTGDEVVES